MSDSQDVALTKGLGNTQPGQMKPLLYRSLSPRRTDLPEDILCAYMLIKVFCFGLFLSHCLKKDLCVCLTLLSFGTQGTNPVFCASSLSPFPCLGFIGAHSSPFPHLVARATFEVHLCLWLSKSSEGVEPGKRGFISRSHHELSYCLALFS